CRKSDERRAASLPCRRSCWDALPSWDASNGRSHQMHRRMGARTNGPLAGSLGRMSLGMMILAGWSLQLHHFFFFCGRELFDFLRFRVSDLFELVQRTLPFVFADFLLLLQFFDSLFHVAPNVSYGRAVILEHLMNVLHKVLAPLFG